MDPTVTPDPAEPPATGRRRALTVVAGVAAGVLVLGAVGAAALARVGADASAAGAPTGAGSVQPPGGGLTPAAAEPGDATDPATPPPLPPAQPTLVLGDSLGLAVYPWLADLLPDRYVSYQAEVGRSTPATEKQLDQIGVVPPVVIVSSGTNDPVANVFEESARRILDLLGPARCVVWVDVVRPDRVGDAQTTMNAALDRAASGRPNVRVLRWTELVAAHPEWMSGDGIHPNEAGAQARARAFAEAAQGCSALDPNAPRARREVLPQSAFWGPVSGQYRSPSSGSASVSSRSGSTGSTPAARAVPRPPPPPGRPTPRRRANRPRPCRPPPRRRAARPRPVRPRPRRRATATSGSTAPTSTIRPDRDRTAGVRHDGSGGTTTPAATDPTATAPAG